MSNTTLMEFPCHFPVKIIGLSTLSFIGEVKTITKRHFPDFKDEQLTQKVSGKNNYLALTVTVFAQNQTMLDSFYQDLTKIADVKMVL